MATDKKKTSDTTQLLEQLTGLVEKNNSGALNKQLRDIHVGSKD